MNNVSLLPYVMITVPHAACIQDYPTRHCDRVAKEASEILKEQFVRQGLPRDHLFYHVNTFELRREDLDMNRTNARGTQWRQELREQAEKWMFKRYLWLLDVHSYPPEHKKIKNLVSYFLYDYDPYDDQYSSKIDALFVEKMVYPGQDNDIMDEMKQHYRARTILLEFSEIFDPVTMKMTRSHRQDVTQICQTISKFVMNYHTED